MKKLLIIGIAAAALAGCGPAVEPESAPEGSLRSVRYGRVNGDMSVGDTVYSKVTIDGHEYVTARGIKCVSIIHAESCPCRNADVVRYKKTVMDGKTWLVPECGRGTAGIPLTE